MVQVTKEQVLTASDGNQYKITVTYGSDAGIPEDAELSVSEFASESKEYRRYVKKAAKKLDSKVDDFNFAHAFDIALVNPETGDHYQPTKPLKVSVKLLDEDVEEDSSIKVVHFGDETEVLESSINGESIEFETDGFSVYVVAQEKLLRHYVFLNGTNPYSDIFSEQALITGESLVEPPMPTKSGAVFSHWELVTEWNQHEVVKNGQTVTVLDSPKTQTTFSFNDYQNITVPTNTTQVELDQDVNKVYFVAVYGPDRTVVTFYNQSGLVWRKEEHAKASGTTLTLEDDNGEHGEYEYIPIQDKDGTVLSFEHWTRNPSGVVHTDADIVKTFTINSSTPESVDFFPVLSEGHYISFDSNRKSINNARASYVTPLFVKSVNREAATTEAQITANAKAEKTHIEGIINGESREDHCIPTVVNGGYTFAGWYTTPEPEDGDVAVFTPVDSNSDGKFDSLNCNAAALRSLLDNTGNLMRDRTLYAKWTGNTTASYTVVVWKEKLNADKEPIDKNDPTKPDDPNDSTYLKRNYSYAESYTVDNVSTTGEADIPDTYRKLNIGSTEGDMYYGFHYSTAMTNASSPTKVKVSPSGSTVVNVLYDRNMHTLTFGKMDWTSSTSGTMYGIIIESKQNTADEYRYPLLHKSGSSYYYHTYSSGNRTNYYNGTLYKKSGTNYIEETSYSYNTTYYAEINGEYKQLKRNEYHSSRYTLSGVQTITAQYGTDLKTAFPVSGYTGASWYTTGSARYTAWLVSIMSMPNEDILFVQRDSNQTGKHMYYYLEQSGADDEPTTNTRNRFETSFYLAKDEENNYPNLIYSVDVSPIVGYETFPDKMEPQFINGGITNKAYTNNGNEAYFYYFRKTYHIEYYDVFGGRTTAIGATGNNINASDTARNIKYKQLISEPISNFNDFPSTNEGEDHAGYTCTYDDGTGNNRVRWYMDKELTTRAFFYTPTQSEINSTKDESGTPHYTVLDRMPAQDALRLYLGWKPITYPVNLILNGGEVGSGQAISFTVDHGKAIGFGANPERNYVKVTSGGEYSYNESTAKYVPAENGEYRQRDDAYVFQGWYEPEYQDDNNDGVPDDPSNPYKLVNGAFPTDTNGEIITRKTPFSTKSVPNRKVTLVAKWQRAGGFYVRYDIKDPALTAVTDADYATIATPDDPEEYIEKAHALVRSASSAPKGYTLAYWTDKNWPGEDADGHEAHEYLPNELVEIAENLCTEEGSAMVLTLTAHYKPYTPSQRLMADYTFMTNVRTSIMQGNVEVPCAPYMDGNNYYEYEKQRITVNESLKAPQAPPAPAGYSFKGWYYDKAGVNRFDGFGVISNPVYTTLYAVYEQVYTVNYYLTELYNDSGVTKQRASNTILATQTYAVDGQRYLDSRHIIHPVDLDHYVIKWVEGSWNNGVWQDATPENAYGYNAYNIKTVDHNLSLRAELKERQYIRFNTHCSVHVDTQEVPVGGWPAEPDAPKRDGYTFKGWWTAETGGEEYKFKTFLPNDSNGKPIETLHAQWEANDNSKGNLHVIFWAQTGDRPDKDEDAATDYKRYQMVYNTEISNLQNGTYSRDQLISWLSEYTTNGTFDLAKTAKFACDANDPTAKTFVNDSLGYKGNNSGVTTSVYNPLSTENIATLNRYYTFNADKSTASLELNDDNGAVLNIRFDLNVFYLDFFTDNKTDIHYDGTTYPTQYTLPVWLNRPLSELWPAILEAGKHTDDVAYMDWKVSDAFYGWKATVTKYDNNVALQSSVQETYRSVLNLADKLLIDSVRTNGYDTVTSGADHKRLKFVLETKPSTELTRTAVLHYLIRDPYRDKFREVDEMRTEIPVEAEPVWNTTPRNYNGESHVPDTEINGKYAKFAGSQCRANNNGLHANNYKYYNANGGTGYYAHKRQMFAYLNLPPTALPGYTALHNTNAHAGPLKEENSDDYEAGYDDTTPKNTSILYNLIASNSALAQAVYGTSDPLYNLYFQSHPEQFVNENDSNNNPKYNFYFYYKPESFKLRFYSDSATQIGTTQTVYCGETLSDFMPSAPTPPDSHTQFAGWSRAPHQTESSQAYSGTTMPAYNLTLYAIWKPVTHTVTTLGVDGNGNAAPGAGNFVYTATHGQQLKAINKPHAIPVSPKNGTELFLGWQEVKNQGQTNETRSDINTNKVVEADMVIAPKWHNMDVRKVQYDANFPTGSSVAPFGTISENNDTYTITPAAAPTAPTDSNSYIVGTKAILSDGDGLYINRYDVDGKPYRADFAYWEDKDGNRYYPNSTFVFRADSPGVELDSNTGFQTLKLKAVYSQYRETWLKYHINAPSDDVEGKTQSGKYAKFVVQGTDPEVKYTNKLSDDGQTVQVLFRDWLNTSWESSFKHKPNDMFLIGDDEDVKTVQEAIDAGSQTGPNTSRFTVVRRDGLGNNYVFGGWADSASATVPQAQNGDKAYVNTIDAEDKNTFYAVWAICKVVDENGTEHLFDSIQKAVNFINDNGKIGTQQVGSITSSTGTVQMLVDYAIGDTLSVNIPEGCTVTLTTAHSGSYQYATADNATIKRGDNSKSLFTVAAGGPLGLGLFSNGGNLTLTNITLDGDKDSYTCTTEGGLISVQKKGSLTIAGGATLTNSSALGTSEQKHGGAVYVAEGGSMTMTDGIISSCTAESGGAVFACGTVTLNGGTIGGTTDAEKNTATICGGGLYIARSLTLSGGTIGGNAISITSESGSVKGGGVYLAGGAEMTMDDGTVCGNTVTGTGGAHADGAGIYVEQNATFTMNGGTVGGTTAAAKNSATNNGGGVYVRGTMTFKDGTVSGNHADKNGGGINVSSDGTLDMTGGTVGGTETGAGNTAGRSGGGICAANNSTIGGTVSGNSAQDGGGIYVTGDSKLLTLTSASVLNNTATENGGGVYVNSSVSVTETGLTLTGQPAPTDLTKPNAKNGGGIYVKNGATFTFSNGTLENCVASENGGGVYVDNSTLTMNGGTIQSCTAVQNGGGVYVNAQGTLAGTGGTIQDCCASENGGAVFTDSGATLSISGATITGHVNLGAELPNAKNGGGIYVNGGELTLDNWTMTGLRAELGAAVYAGFSDSNAASEVTIRGGSISDCTATADNGGAINVKHDTTHSTLSFEGDAVVHGNHNANDTEYQHNVVLSVEDNGVINTTDTGLGSNAHIGVYVVGYNSSEPYWSHGRKATPFGTWLKNQYLDSFTNDLDEGLVGMDLTAINHTLPSDGQNSYENVSPYDKYVYWGSYICKVEDTSGEHPFPTLKSALAHARGLLNGGSTGPIAIEMLVDYKLPSTDQLNLDAATDNIKLTTATTTDLTKRYRFSPTFTAEDRSGEDSDTKAIIKRGTATGSMFTVTTANAAFVTENIVFDGGAVFDETTKDFGFGNETTYVYRSGIEEKDGSIVNVSKGALTIGQGTTMQNSAVASNTEGDRGKRGGAVYVSTTGTLSITGTASNPVVFTKCQARGGGAIKTGDDEPYEGTVSMEYCSFSYCHAKGTKDDGGKGPCAGGAVHCMANTFTLNHCDFTGCTSVQQGAGVYHRGSTELRIENCMFTNGHAGVASKVAATAGGAETQAKNVTVNYCEFTHCSSNKNAGAFNVYNTNSNITVINSRFDTCKASGTGAEGNGGALRTTGTSTTVENCTFDSCETSRRGGAIHCKTDTTIKGTTTINGCKATEIGGGGVYLNGGTLTIEAGTIQNCNAPDGGAIYQGGGTCNFNDGSITNCVATKSAKDTNGHGGGIYLQSGTFKLQGGSVSSCKAVGYGGGIYLGGGTFEFKSGSISTCAAKAGGGIYADVASDKTVKITASGNAISECEARSITISGDTITVPTTFAEENKGGGIYQANGTLNITDATINQCKAYDGGGIYLGGTKPLNMGESGKKKGATISGCEASHNGAGIYQAGGTLNIYKESSVISNAANGGNGGGVYLGGGTLTIESGATVTGNEATGNGGGIYLAQPQNTTSKLFLHGAIGGTTDGSGNTATNGGGIYQDNGVMTVYSGASVTGNKVNDGNGGGVYLGGGTLEISNNVTVSKNTAEGGNGGGICLDGNGTLTLSGANITANEAHANTTGTTPVGGNGGGIYLQSGTFNFNSGTIGGTTAGTGNTATNGGGIYQGGGRLTIDGRVQGNVATPTSLSSDNGGYGGGIYLGGGTFTLSSGKIGDLNEEGEPTENRVGGNTARKGGGLYVGNGTSSADNDLTKARIEGGVIGGNYATEVAGGGGIAIGGENVRLYFSGNIQVWGNTMEPNPDHPLQKRCDVCLNVHSNDVIRTTTDGLDEDSHIGVYVTDDIVQSGADKDKQLHWDLHGRANMQFGTFEDGTNSKGAENLSRFINNRSGNAYDGYEYYYGVCHPDDGDKHGIYWACYVCEITTHGPNPKLLFTNKKATAPALYQYLYKYGAFADLNKPNKKFYYKETDSTGAITIKQYEGPKFDVRMLVFDYTLERDLSVKVPTNKEIYLMMADKNDENLPDELSNQYDSYNGCTTIKRGTCTSYPMFTTEANSKFTIQSAIIDGGAVFDADGQCIDASKVGVDGALIKAGGDVTLGNKATLQNSVIKKTGNNHYGAAVWFNGPGTFTMGSGSKIQCCYATGDSCGGAVLYVKADESDIVNFAAPSEAGQISNCTAKNGLVYVRQGTLNLTGAFSGELNDPTSPTNVVNVENCSSENGGLAFVTGGTLNLGAAVSGFRSDSTKVIKNGGVLFVTGGTANLTGTVSDCTAKNNGGAAYVNGSGTLNLNGTIQDCEAPNGGGVCAKGGTVHLEQSGSKITNCTASNGGAISAGVESNKTPAAVNMSAGELSGNTATGYGGGAIRLEGGSSTTISGSAKIINNEVKPDTSNEKFGGAIYVDKGSLTISGGTFSNNLVEGSGKPAFGGAIHVNGNKGNSSTLTISGGTFSGNKADATGGSVYGGAVSLRGPLASAVISGGTIADNTATTNNKDAFGGAIAVLEGASVTMSGGTVVCNRVKTGATNRKAQGPGIYLGYKKIDKLSSNNPDDIVPGILKLSGSPNFGGTGTTDSHEIYYLTSNTAANGKTVYRRCYKNSDGVEKYPDKDDDRNKDDYYLWEEGQLYRVNSDGTVYYDDTHDGNGNTVHHAVDGNVIPGIGNFLTTSLTNKKNGGMPYTRTREDIYIAGYESESDSAQSLKVTGRLKNPDGTDITNASIWIGAEKDARRKQNMQFATFGGDALDADNKVKSEVDAENTMKAFRNAYDDETTENGTEGYLYGEAGDGVLINWNGVKGSARVILKKVDESNQPLAGAEFTLFKKNQNTVVTVKKTVGDTISEEQVTGKSSGSSGVFWIGDLPYGTYYLHETKKAGGADEDKWFYFILDENFQIMSTEYDNDGTAKTAGEAETKAVSWASKIISGKNTFNDLPNENTLRNRVKELLNQSGHSDKITTT